MPELADQRPEVNNSRARGFMSRLFRRPSSEGISSRNPAEVLTLRQRINYKKLFRGKKVIFLGESHWNSQVREHISECARQMKRAGVTHYAIEVPDTYTRFYDALNRGEEVDLSKINVGPLSPLFGGRQNYELAIRAMHDVGIKVVPIDIEQSEETNTDMREQCIANNMLVYLNKLVGK